jgi:hypothetical protein
MKRKIVSMTFAAVVAMGGVLLPVSSAVAQTPPGLNEVDTACTNPGGNQPPGQQPTCQGEALDQETEVQNRAGHAPPGQNR